MVKINSVGVFIKLIAATALVLYFSFRIFNYVYPGNYCDFLSDSVILNTQEDTSSTKRCVNTLVCEVSDVKLIDLGNNEKQKEFICLRKNQAGVWKW